MTVTSKRIAPVNDRPGVVLSPKRGWPVDRLFSFALPQRQSCNVPPAGEPAGCRNPKPLQGWRHPFSMREKGLGDEGPSHHGETPTPIFEQVAEPEASVRTFVRCVVS